MRRKISVHTAMIIGLSAILGDTAFVITGLPISFDGIYSIIAYAVVAIFSVLLAIELGGIGALYPKYKGLSYSYVNRTFGTELGFTTGVLLYFSFCAIIATVSFSFGSYLLSFFGLPQGIIEQIAIAGVMILALSFLNRLGLKETIKISKVIVLIIGLTVAAFLYFSASHLATNYGSALTDFKSAIPQNGTVGLTGALAIIVFAYAGFQVVASLTGRIKDGGNGARKAMVRAIPISAAVYIIITLALISLASPNQFASVSNPIVYAMESADAPAFLVSGVVIGILFSIAAATMALIFTAARIMHQMGRDGLMPRITSGYDRKRDTPTNSIWLTAAFSMSLLLVGNLYTMASISNFGMLFSWILVSFATVDILRKRGLFGKRMLYVAALSAGFGMYLMFGLPSDALALGFTVFLFLIVVYYLIIELRHKKVPRTKLFTYQKLIK